MKDFDTFSFKAKSHKKIDEQQRQNDFQPIVRQPPKNWRQMTYRFEKNLSTNSNKVPTFESYFIHEKINKIDEELTQNIKRRIQLEKSLYKEKQEIRQKQNQVFFKQNNIKSEMQAAEVFANMERKTDKVQRLLQRQRQSEQSNKQKYLNQIQQSQLKKKQYLHKKQGKQKKFIVPDQIKIQKLIKVLTFPEIPSINLEKAEQQCQEMLISSQHSDISYLLMVINFHQQKYHNVRKYFRQIQMYKTFQPKAFWVACENQYELESYELCLKLSEKCIKQLSDVHFPRFVYLQAKCYEKLGNYINSIVFFNQVIKMKPKVAQLYLDRAMIYDKIGYPFEAKQDYIQFSTLQPRARELLREKIMLQKNEIRRKQMIKALAKIS